MAGRTGKVSGNTRLCAIPERRTEGRQMIVVSCCVAIKDIMMGGISACFCRLLGKIILRQMGPFPVAGHNYIENPCRSYH